MATIKICDKCDGEGNIYTSDRFEGYMTHTCKKCKGFGRIKTYGFTYEVPIDADSKEINSTQEKILSLIRESEKRVY